MLDEGRRCEEESQSLSSSILYCLSVCSCAMCSRSRRTIASAAPLKTSEDRSSVLIQRSFSFAPQQTRSSAARQQISKVPQRRSAQQSLSYSIARKRFETDRKPGKQCLGAAPDVPPGNERACSGGAEDVCEMGQPVSACVAMG